MGMFPEDQAPEWVWDPSLEHQAPKTNDGREWKKGFHVMILLPQEYAPFQLREFATTGVSAVEGHQRVVCPYEQASKDQNPGKVPLLFNMSAQRLPQLLVGKVAARTSQASRSLDGLNRPAAFDEPLGDDGNNQSQQQFVNQSGFAQPTQQSEHRV